MSNIRITIDENKLREIVLQAYAQQHGDECAYCHKPVARPKDLPVSKAPVCEDCAKKRRLS